MERLLQLGGEKPGERQQQTKKRCSQTAAGPPLELAVSLSSAVSATPSAETSGSSSNPDGEWQRVGRALVDAADLVCDLRATPFGQGDIVQVCL